MVYVKFKGSTVSLPHLTFTSIICPNWITDYTLVTVVDFHFMQNNFTSLFCRGCEISNVEKGGKENCQNRISESVCVLSNGVRNPFDY